MIKLYSSMDHPHQWVAYVPDAGWLVFPDHENGWAQRKAIRGLDPIHLRQVPLTVAAHSGLQPPPSKPVFKNVA